MSTSAQDMKGMGCFPTSQFGERMLIDDYSGTGVYRPLWGSGFWEESWYGNDVRERERISGNTALISGYVKNSNWSSYLGWTLIVNFKAIRPIIDPQYLERDSTSHMLRQAYERKVDSEVSINNSFGELVKIEPTGDEKP